MQAALDDWDRCEPQLRALAASLEAGTEAGSFPLDLAALGAPLPRAYGWIDSGVYLSHMERARALRGATLPETYRQDPLISLRLSAPFLPAHAPIDLPPGDLGLDMEAELAVILDDVECGIDRGRAANRIRLVTLVNDTSLRTVLAAETATGRSVYRGKAAAAMAPFAVTPDELGAAWAGASADAVLEVTINGTVLGRPFTGTDASFDFADIIAYASAFRPLVAGTVIASGTVSNRDTSVGTACIAERRMLETTQSGLPQTPYLQPGDVIRIEARNRAGRSLFGAIEQCVVGE
jgi:fumarylacetoacetate (FAA) hydrolase